MKKAIIVGGSIGGLLAGNMLVREGWTVEILERTKEGLEARGAGIVPQRSLLAALKRAGVTVRPDIGIRVTKRVAYNRAGVAFATHQYDQYSTSWSLLYNLLRDAFPAQYFQAGSNVAEIGRTKMGWRRFWMTERSSTAIYSSARMGCARRSAASYSRRCSHAMQLSRMARNA